MAKVEILQTKGATPRYYWHSRRGNPKNIAKVQNYASHKSCVKSIISEMKIFNGTHVKVQDHVKGLQYTLTSGGNKYDEAPFTPKQKKKPAKKAKPSL